MTPLGRIVDELTHGLEVSLDMEGISDQQKKDLRQGIALCNRLLQQFDAAIQRSAAVPSLSAAEKAARQQTLSSRLEGCLCCEDWSDPDNITKRLVKIAELRCSGAHCSDLLQPISSMSGTGLVYMIATALFMPEVNIDGLNPTGRTPLYEFVRSVLAPWQGICETEVGSSVPCENLAAHQIVSMLLACGADTRQQNKDGETPLDLIAKAKSHMQRLSAMRVKPAFREQVLNPGLQLCNRLEQEFLWAEMAAQERMIASLSEDEEDL
jgi:hypothetical protein